MRTDPASSARREIAAIALAAAVIPGCSATKTSRVETDPAPAAPVASPVVSEPALSNLEMRNGRRDLSRLSYECGALLPAIIEGTSAGGTPFEVVIPPEVYERYQGRMERRHILHLPDLASSNEYLTGFLTPHDPLITDLAAALCEGASSAEAKAQHLLDWCRRTVRYDEIEAEDDRNYIRFPVETLMERAGDCEDLVLLYASLCRAADVPIVLIRQLGHLTCAVEGEFRPGAAVLDGDRVYFMADPVLPEGTRIGYWPTSDIRGVLIPLKD